MMLGKCIRYVHVKTTSQAAEMARWIHDSVQNQPGWTLTDAQIKNTESEMELCYETEAGFRKTNTTFSHMDKGNLSVCMWGDMKVEKGLWAEAKGLKGKGVNRVHVKRQRGRFFKGKRNGRGQRVENCPVRQSHGSESTTIRWPRQVHKPRCWQGRPENRGAPSTGPSSELTLLANLGSLYTLCTFSPRPHQTGTEFGHHSPFPVYTLSVCALRCTWRSEVNLFVLFSV